MTRTPPSVEAAQPGSANSSAPASATTPSAHDHHDGHDERTRRNVACVNCRNSKVRCRTSPVPGQPCQRCAKLAISCVVDKTHKRVTKRSKLEQLEQELKSIRQVVQPTANGTTPAWTPPSPRAAVSALPEQRPSTAINHQRGTPQVPTPQPESSVSQVRSTQSSERRMKTAPTEARLLENHIVSGEDIDWYFTKYLQCFHPYMPILRIRDPDECFDACPTLFWIVIYVASRRYPRDRSLFPLVVDHLGKEIWLMASTPAMNYEGVHALLLLCNWPLPTVRFVTDPSPMFGAMALQSAMFLGCHTGRGNHPDYHVGLRQHFLATDEEASATWLACCIAAQRTTSAAGIPPPTTQYSDVRQKAALESPAWTDVLAMHEVQRFLNKMHTAMYAQLTANGGVPESSVAMWETDFESLKPLLIRYDTDISRFCMLATQLELQQYYFLPLPNAPLPPQSVKAHAVRIFNTSRAIIALSLDLESRTQFLTHATHWILRVNVDATVMILAILHSASAPGMNEADADLLIQQACGAVLRCSVRDADLPHRVSIIMDTFWSIRHLVPSIGQAPQGRVDRLASGVTFWCLHRFRTSLQSAEKSTDRVNKALEIMQARCTNNPHSAPPITNGQPQQQGALNSDPIQDVDWSMFMDDFGWVGDENALLGLPPNMSMQG